MQKVKLIKQTSWVWDCPSCEHLNDEYEDPDDLEIVRCEACHELYISRTKDKLER